MSKQEKYLQIDKFDRLFGADVHKRISLAWYAPMNGAWCPAYRLTRATTPSHGKGADNEVINTRQHNLFGQARNLPTCV